MATQVFRSEDFQCGHTLNGPAIIEAPDTTVVVPEERKIRVDEYGNIQNWPVGFFGDEMEDLVARSEAQARRMHKRGKK